MTAQSNLPDLPEPVAYGERHGGKYVSVSLDVTGWHTSPLFSLEQIIAERRARIKAEELLRPFIKISADIPEENFWPTDVLLPIRAAAAFLASKDSNHGNK